MFCRDINPNYGSESSQNYRVLCVCVRVSVLWPIYFFWVLSTKSGHDWDSKVRQWAHTNEEASKYWHRIT